MQVFGWNSLSSSFPSSGMLLIWLALPFRTSFPVCSGNSWPYHPPTNATWPCPTCSPLFFTEQNRNSVAGVPGFSLARLKYANRRCRFDEFPVAKNKLIVCILHAPTSQVKFALGNCLHVPRILLYIYNVVN